MIQGVNLTLQVMNMNFNLRKSDSSTDECQTVKDYLRKEEMKGRQIRKWEREYKIGMTKQQYMMPGSHTALTPQQRDEIDKLINKKIEAITDEIHKMKREKALVYIKEDIKFWRKLLMYISIAKC